MPRGQRAADVEAAEAALDAVEECENAATVGVTYEDFGPIVLEAYSAADDFLETDSAERMPEFGDALAEAADNYVTSYDLWGDEIGRLSAAHPEVNTGGVQRYWGYGAEHLDEAREALEAY